MGNTPVPDAELVIVTTLSGEKLIGSKPKGTDSQRFLLRDARRLLINADARTSATGEIQAIQIGGAVLPIDLCSGPMDVLVTPDYYYPVDSDENLKQKVVRLLNNALASEQRSRAAERGIIVPK
jgi:hypothetical protein